MRVKKNYTLGGLMLLVLVFSVSAFVGKNDPVIPSESIKKTAAVVAGPASQDEMPKSVDEVIKWNTRVEQNGCEATLIVEVKQLDGWHIYSQILPEDGVSIPTTFYFDENPTYQKIGKVQEPHTEVEDNGGIPERAFHGDKVVFKQKIKALSKNDFKIGLEIEFMACKTSCFPPSYKNFEFNIKGCSGGSDVKVDEKPDAKEADPDENIDSAEVSEPVKSPVGWQFYAVKVGKAKFELRAVPSIPEGWYLLEEGLEYNIETNQLAEEVDPVQFFGVKEVVLDSTTSKKIRVLDNDSRLAGIIVSKGDSLPVISGQLSFTALNNYGKTIKVNDFGFTIDLNKSIEESETTETKGSYWKIFLLALLGGFAALLTPCVFPMIPLTVSFFTKGSQNRKKGIARGTTYGLSILLIYVLLSVPFHVLDQLSPNILNEISTNVPLNIFFFLMLAVFAFSFLGAFEITLPSKWTNKVDSASNIGGVIGIFLMAVTLALVSFSCTGPILGSLLASASGSAGGDAWALTAGMAGFGVALGLPFALFAIFPSWLNTLPSSGGWLNSVKVVLGFLELAFAFKFLSNADLAVQAHLLERELFIALWLGIFGALTLYLFGVYRAAHDSPLEKLSVTRLSFGVLSLSFTLYLLPGLWGAPLKLISAFPPPQHYSEIPYGIHGSAPEGEGDLPEGAEYGPHQLPLFHYYDDALKYAREKGKPLMIDFTGWNCVNCRKMEMNVWVDQEVLKILKNEVVIVSLYVDSREELPSPEVSPYTGRKLITQGDKWADFQSSVYKKSTQPQYILLDHNEMMLNTDVSYTSHGTPSAFKNWLERGIKEFEKRKDIKVEYPIIE